MEKKPRIEIADKLSEIDDLLRKARSINWVLLELIFTDKRTEGTFVSYTPQIIKDLITTQDNYIFDAAKKAEEAAIDAWSL